MTSRRTSARPGGGGTAASIRAVAERAGVSTATISRALRFPDLVTEETRRRVMAAVDELGYRPNVAARNLRMRRAHAVIVLVPTITNPFFAPIIRSAERVASARGYSVLLGETDQNDLKEKQLAQLALNGQVDGILQLGGRWPCDYPVSEDTRTRLVNACELFDAPVVSSVSLDNAAAAEAMIDHLTTLGHRNIAIVTGPADSRLTHDRRQGAERALARLGLTPAAVLEGDHSMQSGADAADRLHGATSARPTVVFCFNDEMALGVMHRFAALGLRIPEDVGVCGFDDIDVARFCSPALTTMAQPKERIGERAMEILLQSIEGEQAEPVHDLFSATLVQRASVLPLDRMS